MAPSAATARPLLAALDQHRQALREHLEDEEQLLLPLIEQHLSAAEWAKLGQRFAEETPKNKLLFFLGAILDEATAAEEAALLTNLPAPVRLIWRTGGRPWYHLRINWLRRGVPGSGTC